MGTFCDIAITGIGTVTPFGVGMEVLWQGLMAAVSAVRRLTEYGNPDSPFSIGAPIRDFDGRQYVKPRKALKVMCPPIVFGVASADLAVQSSSVSAHVQPERLATVFGTESFYADPLEVANVFRKCIVNRVYDHDRWGEYSMREIEPLWMLKYLPNMAASHISIAHNAQGPSNTICQADASGALALVESVDWLERGAVDAIIAGGTGSPLSVTGMVYRGSDQLSRRVDDPPRASRPFDRWRDGMVLGEGAGVYVLERTADAAARGAAVQARIIGYARGFYPPGGSRLAPRLADLIRLTIDRSGLQPADIGHVNAHGLGTVEDDRGEAQAIRAVLGHVPVVAWKGNFGNLGPSGGLVETAASVLALQRGILPPTINCDDLDPDCPVNVIREPAPVASPYALKINFAPQGQIVVYCLAGQAGVPLTR